MNLKSLLAAAARQRVSAELFHREVTGGVEVAIEVELDAVGPEFSEVVFPKPHRTPMEIGMEGKPI